MIVKSCNFVESTEVFKDCQKAWELFCDSNPDCTWGDNNRTMVTNKVIIDAIENVFDSEDSEVANQVSTVFKRLNELPYDTYIDLEN
jgi:hypothetical protein